MEKFDWGAFAEEKIAIIFHSEQEWLNFAKEASMRKFGDCVSRGDEMYPIRNICPENPLCVASRGYILTHGPSSYYIKEGYAVVAWHSVSSFTKEDLKNGDIVTFGDGTRHILFKEKGKFFGVDVGGSVQYLSLADLKQDLTTRAGITSCDVEKVERNGGVIWTRKKHLEKLQWKRLISCLAKKLKS